MSQGTFVTFGSPWSNDHREQFYREQEAKRHLANRIERSTLWLQIRLGGETFASEDQMRAVVVGLATDLGYKMDDDFTHVLTEAVRTLWSSGRYRVVAAA